MTTSRGQINRVDLNLDLQIQKASTLAHHVTSGMEFSYNENKKERKPNQLDVCFVPYWCVNTKTSILHIELLNSYCYT